MQNGVQAQVPVLYVADADAARRFYEAFGYSEARTGGDGESRWSYLQCGELTLLLAAVKPRLVTVELPLLLYLYVDDLDATLQRLTAAGYPTERVGYPEHAPGGECRTVDPDGNVVLFGQRRAVPAQARVAPTGREARFSLIREAAEAVSRRGGAPPPLPDRRPPRRGLPGAGRGEARRLVGRHGVGLRGARRGGAAERAGRLPGHRGRLRSRAVPPGPPPSSGACHPPVSSTATGHHDR